MAIDVDQFIADIATDVAALTAAAEAGGFTRAEQYAIGQVITALDEAKTVLFAALQVNAGVATDAPPPPPDVTVPVQPDNPVDAPPGG